MKPMDGKVAVVTGSWRGIGRATARKFAQAGASVFLAAEGPAAELESARNECRVLNPAGRAECGIFDLAQQDAPERMVQTALASLYGITKAALIFLARGMSIELAKDNIQVNAVSPGPIMTEYNAERMAQLPKLHAERVAALPIGRFGEPDEIAESILWLASGAPAFAQGINLVVDGGYTAH